MHAFLPKLAEENRQLEAAVEAGHGTAFNIEVEEETDKPTIQMNFALGLMDNAVPDHHDDDDTEIELKVSAPPKRRPVIEEL